MGNIPAISRTVSKKAECFIAKKFGPRAEPIFRKCEREAAEFVSDFFNAASPEIKLSYKMRDEVESSSRRSYAFFCPDAKSITFITDNAYERFSRGAVDFDVVLASILVHEIQHFFDADQTPLGEKREEMVSIYKSLAAERKMGRFWFFKRTKPEFLEIISKIRALNALIEGRATRLEWLFLQHKLATKTVYSDLEATLYLSNANQWHFDCALFMEFLEKHFGPGAWKISETILPISLTEIEKPDLYVARVSKMEDFVRNSN